MRILISGAGIAGPTLAYWLAHYGFTPTIIEASPRLRIDGYLIDFWGAGYDVAERMGLLPEISSHGYAIREVKVIARSGRRVAGFPAEAFSRITRGRFASIPRGALAASIFSKIESKVETIFGDSVDRIFPRWPARRRTTRRRTRLRSRRRSRRPSFASPRSRLWREKQI